MTIGTLEFTKFLAGGFDTDAFPATEKWLPLRGKVVSVQQLVGFSLTFSILDDKERVVLNELVQSQI